MASIHPIHQLDAAYGPPEVHIPYPAEPANYPAQNVDEDPDRESLTGELKGDETTAEEWAQSEAAFSNAVLEKIGIAPSSRWQQHETLQERERMNVLLPIAISAADEKELHEKVMASLRNRVAALEEEELFESSMRSFTQRASATTDPYGSTLAVASNLAGVPGESNAPGMGEQLRATDVKRLLKADTKEVWARVRERMERDA